MNLNPSILLVTHPPPGVCWVDTFGGVVAVTAIVAVFSMKSPRKQLLESEKLVIRLVTPRHSMSSESTIPLTRFPSGRAVLILLGTVNASNTQMLRRCSEADPSPRLTCALPSGTCATQATAVGDTPASQECKPNGLVRLSIHMNTNEP
jgi:Ni,Fe-hydrogenase III small subunit